MLLLTSGCFVRGKEEGLLVRVFEIEILRMAIAKNIIKWHRPRFPLMGEFHDGKATNACPSLKEIIVGFDEQENDRSPNICTERKEIS